MKNLKYLALCMTVLIGLTACEDDNFPGPKETFKGAFTDKTTKEPFQTAIGTTGIRFELLEYSWSENPQPYHMTAKMDGTFQNTKVFKGEYGVKPEGAFVPLAEERFKIAGTVTKNYEVEPFLRIEWDPTTPITVNDNGSVIAKVKITRGTTNAAYQHALAEAWLFISETSYVGDFSYNTELSTQITPSLLPQVLNQTIDIPSGYAKRTTQKFFPAYSRKYFIRVGARTNYAYPSALTHYNYSTVKEFTYEVR